MKNTPTGDGRASKLFHVEQMIFVDVHSQVAIGTVPACGTELCIAILPALPIPYRERFRRVCPLLPGEGAF